jgi:hypothetical protein
MLDGGGVAEEVVEGCGQGRHRVLVSFRGLSRVPPPPRT